MPEPFKIGIAWPKIGGVDEVVLVRSDPQLLRSGARLDFLEGGDDAGLKDVKPAGHMKTWDIDRATEIVPRTKDIRRWVSDDLVAKRLPQGKVRRVSQRQMQPDRRIDERRIILTGGVEPVVALGGRGGGAVEFGGINPEPRHNRLAVRRGQAGNVFGNPQPQPLDLETLALVDDIVIDAGPAGLGKKGVQARGARGRRSKGRGGTGRGAGHASSAVRPALAGNPFQRVVAVISVIGVDPVLALGAVS